MKLTNRADLQDTYINTIIDNMSLKDMQEVLYMMMEDDMEDISDEQLIKEIQHLHPELLGWYQEEWDAPL